MEISLDKITVKNKKVQKELQKNLTIDNPEEIISCLGKKLINIQVNIGSDKQELGAYNNEDCEIMLEFDNGKEWRIYINNSNRLHIYSD